MHINGLVLVALSGVMFSIMSFLADYCISKGVSTSAIQLVRGVFMIIFPTLVLIRSPYHGLLRHHLFGSTKTVFALGILRGLLGFGGVGCFYLSLQYLSLSSASVIFFSLPIWTPFVGHFLLNESLYKSNVLCSLIGVLGMVLITQPSFIFGDAAEPEDEYKRSPRILGVLFALIGSFFGTGVYITVRVIGNRIHSTSLVLFMGSVMLTLSSFWILVKRLPLSFGLHLWGVLAAIGVLSVLGQVMFMKGVQMEEAGPASIVRNLDIIFSFVLQSIFLKTESFDWLAVFGAVLIVTSVFYVGVEKYYREKNKKESSQSEEDEDLSEKGLLDEELSIPISESC